jgi:hypothetical protein
METNFKAIEILVGIEYRRGTMLDKLDSIKLDFTDLTDKLHTDSNGNDITDAIGALVDMSGEEVFRAMEYFRSDGRDDIPSITTTLIAMGKNAYEYKQD